MIYPVLGIDLGTCFSCVYGYKNGQYVVVPAEAGGNTTPSVIQYKENRIICGKAAKNSIRGNETNTIYDVKRFLGLPYEQCAQLIEHERYGFRCIPYPPTMMYEIKINNNRLFKTPELVDADFLKYLVDRAERFLGYRAEGLVITVPAFFQYSQIDATLRAAQTAGLNVYQTLYEPSAAAIALTPIPSIEERYILVYDLGGGTFDVAIIRAALHGYSIIANNGHPFLGGRDFDQVMFDIVKRKLSDNGIDVNAWRFNKLIRLRAYCEEVKIELSTTNAVELDMSNFDVGDDIPIFVSRAEFQNGIRDLLRASIQICDAALQQAHVELQVGRDSILLVGGSSKVPLVRTMLEEHYGRIVRNDNNPDQDVAKGACMVAMDIYCNNHPPLPNPTPIMIPHSFVMRPVAISFGNGQIQEILPVGTPRGEERELVGNNFMFATTVRVFCKDDILHQERPWREIGRFTVNAFRGNAYIRLVLNEAGRLRYSVGVVGHEPTHVNTLELAREDPNAIVRFDNQYIAIRNARERVHGDLETEQHRNPPRNNIITELNRGLDYLDSNNAFLLQVEQLNQYADQLHNWYLANGPSLVCFYQR